MGWIYAHPWAPLEPELPERKGMFHFERSATFFWQTRIEGEGHLAVTYLEKAFGQLITGYSAVAVEGNTARCVYFTPCGHLTHLWQREAPGLVLVLSVTWQEAQ